MGVKDLWSILSPTGELLPLSSLSNTVLAIDLSCWICDSQNTNMANAVTRPHLRNLFFRTVSLLKVGAIPIFVLEGEAPQMKWGTIENRLNRNSRTRNSNTLKSCKRSRLKGLINQCCELFNLMGVPWVQATGEAEATCAALCYHKIADGVITQDSDVFLYGADLVFRNFSGKQSGSTVEKFNLGTIEKKLGLDRRSMVVLAVLLGCDYLPAGVPSVGKEMALKLLARWREEDIDDPVQRIREWKLKEDVCESHSRKSGKKCKDMEDIVREKSLATPGFPFECILQEFQRRLSKPVVKPCWQMPKLPQLIKWLGMMLDWEENYCFEKAFPVFSFWTLTNTTSQEPQNLIEVDKILRKRIRKREDSFEVQWRMSPALSSSLCVPLPSLPVTVEEASLVLKVFPLKIQEFLQQTDNERKARKKEKAASRRKETKSTKKSHPSQESNKENLDPSYQLDDSVDEGNLSHIIEKFINMRTDDELQPSSAYHTIEANSQNNHFTSKVQELSAKYLEEVEVDKEPSLICLSDSDESLICSKVDVHPNHLSSCSSKLPKSLSTFDAYDEPSCHTKDENGSFSFLSLRDCSSREHCSFNDVSKDMFDHSFAVSDGRKGSFGVATPCQSNRSSLGNFPLSPGEIRVSEKAATPCRNNMRRSYSVPCFKLLDSFNFAPPDESVSLSPKTEINLEPFPQVLDSCLKACGNPVTHLPSLPPTPKQPILDSTFEFSPQLSLLDRLKKRYGSSLTSAIDQR